MWLLINIYYPKYTLPKKEGGGLQKPAEVTKYTNQYKKSTDVYMEFMEEFVKPCDDDDAEENIDQLYCFFRKWYRTAYENKSPLRKDFIDYIKNSNKYNIKDGMIKNVKFICSF
jgi:hypothetical protein